MKKFIAGKTRIPASYPMIDEEEHVEVAKVLKRGWFTEGRACNDFASLLSDVVGQEYIELCNSGSSADLLAVAALPKEKRYVITCAVGFPTTLTSIYHNNLVPLYIDIDPNTLAPSMGHLQYVLESPNYKDDIAGAILTHNLGFPYDEKMAKELLEDRWLISDCCDALGSKIYGKHVGSYSDISTYSFFPAHHITTAEGGAVCTNNPETYLSIRSLNNWGRDCFIPGTEVKTLDGQIPIENVLKGDFVLDTNGDYSEVLNVWSRGYTGNFYSIKCRTRPEITSTKEHPFYIYRNKEFMWEEAHNLVVGDCLVEAIPRKYYDDCSNDYYKFSWEYDTLYKTKHFDVVGSPDLYRLIGYYLSQGSLASGLKGKSGYKENKYKFYRVDFSFNKNKTHLVDDVISLMSEFFGCSASTREKHGAIQIHCKSRKAYEFFNQFFSRLAPYKRLDYDLFYEESYRNLIFMVEGFVLGDGHVDYQGVSFSSTSDLLFEQFREILLGNKILGSYNRRTKDKHSPSVINEKLVEQKHDLHTLKMYGKNAERFSDLTGFEYSSRTDKQFSWVDDNLGYAFYPITFIEIQEKYSTVYNLHIDNSQTFHANGVVVHNCYCLPGQQDVCGKRFEQEFSGLPEGWDHKYTFTQVGYNLKMTEFQAAFGVAQIKKLQNFVDLRLENFYELREVINSWHEHLKTVHIPDFADASPFGFPISVASDLFNTSELIAHLERNKIATRRMFGGNLVRQPAFQGLPHAKCLFEYADFVMENTFWIGCGPWMDGEMIDYIEDVLGEFFND